METRSGALYEISKLIHELRPELDYQRNHFGSVTDLKREFLGLRSRKLGKIEQLEALRDELIMGGMATIEQWGCVPADNRRSALIDDDEIKRLKIEGKTLTAIAKVAGISKQRVKQICG
jgi:hypothetical protein